MHIVNNYTVNNTVSMRKRLETARVNHYHTGPGSRGTYTGCPMAVENNKDALRSDREIFLKLILNKSEM